ncbi:MAG: DUF547 domain-containing protein [Pseudomonadota bacterium]
MRRLTLATGALLMSLMPHTANADEETRNQPWNDLLSRYLIVGDDGVNRFDYGGLQANTADAAALSAYLESFADLDMDTLDRDAQFAAYANAYNALTIQHIVDRYPVKSIRSGYIVGPWKRVKMTIDGRELSLDAIEHDVLREDWDEPRVHYAVNCASYGCPNLQPVAWQAETLDQDLTAAARAFINHPRGVTVRERGGLQVSTIYKWFRKDFGGDEDGVIDHLLTYANPVLAEAIRANADIKKHDYNWSLNDVQ